MKISFPNNEFPATDPEKSYLLIKSDTAEEAELIEKWYNQIIKCLKKLNIK